MGNVTWAETLNPISGCDAVPISPGCFNCYARKMANRLRGRCGYDLHDPFRPTFHPEQLNRPARWRKPRRVFLCSMGDWAHPKVDPAWMVDTLEMLLDANHKNRWMLLTKRPHGAIEMLSRTPYLASLVGRAISVGLLWLGVSAESQEWVWRVRTLSWLLGNMGFVPDSRGRFPLFLSAEPLLGPIDLERCEDADRIGWVVAGAETGQGARPCAMEWLNGIRDWCVERDVEYWLKASPQPWRDDGGLRHDGVMAPGGHPWREFPEGLRV